MINYQKIRVNDKVFIMSIDQSQNSTAVNDKMRESVGDGKLYTVTAESGSLALVTNGEIYHKSDLHLQSDSSPYKNIKTEPQVFNIENLGV